MELPKQHKKHPTLAEAEKLLIFEVVQHCNCNKVLAAKVLGIAKATLYRKLKLYGWEES